MLLQNRSLLGLNLIFLLLETRLCPAGGAKSQCWCDSIQGLTINTSREKH